MTANRKESKFSSKELNKIFPSYLLEEIDTEQCDSESSKNSKNSLIGKTYNKEYKKDSYLNDKSCYKNDNLNMINNMVNNKEKFIYNNNINNSRTLDKNLSGNCSDKDNNIYINIMNHNTNNNSYIFCNYNTFSNYFNCNCKYLSADNLNLTNLNNFNLNNFNLKINNSNYLFPNNHMHNMNFTNNIFNKNNENIINNEQKEKEINSININTDTDEAILNNFIKYIKEIKVPIINYICDSKGALYLQKILENSGNDIKLYIIQNLNNKGLIQIMKDVYGNYFFQKLIKNTNKDIISLIISYIIEDFINISKDSSGTFSIQALLYEIKSIKDYLIILEKIKGYELEMVYDKNATYVLQKIVLIFPDFIRENLNEIILNNFIKLCLDVNGICLIKNFIKTNNSINNKIKIKFLICNNFLLLSQSPFGNYAVQFLMENWNNSDLVELFEKVYENIFILSIQQFSSNVVEKGIEIMDEYYQGKIMQKIFFEDKFIFLLKNKFGKFVINKAYKYMKPEMKKEIELSLINNLNNFSYKEKNIINKFLARIHKNASNKK